MDLHDVLTIGYSKLSDRLCCLEIYMYEGRSICNENSPIYPIVL